VQNLLPPREAANILGISYPTLKQWIYHGKIKSVKTPGGHHRVPESEIDRLIPKKFERGDLATRRLHFRKISGRNQLIGRVVALKHHLDYYRGRRERAASKTGRPRGGTH